MSIIAGYGKIHTGIKQTEYAQDKAYIGKLGLLA